MTRPSRLARFDLWVIGLGILAFALREYYVLVARVDAMLVGDAREYWSYAWNLVHQGVFSGTTPPKLAVPDAYRLPGYPWLIAAAMQVTEAWYPLVLLVQAVLGAMTVVFVALLTRQWTSQGWALASGFLVAIWPHHVAATNTLLSEVLFGFLLCGGLLAFSRAWTTGRAAWHSVAGATFGYAWLVNPLLLLFPPLLALIAWRHGQRRGIAIMLAVFLVPVIGMSVRNAIVDAQASSTTRVGINFVQGSWPQYHAAANRFRTGDPHAIAIMREINAEQAQLQVSIHAGLERIGQRIAAWPSYYVEWYATKPWLLWGWQIQMGATDISFHRIAYQPFDRNPVLHGLLLALRALNPLLTTVALACALTLAVAGWRQASWVPAAATGVLTLYVTVVHLVLQAEPRYATAYRGIEAALIASALAWAWTWARTERHASPPTGGAIGG